MKNCGFDHKFERIAGTRLKRCEKCEKIVLVAADRNKLEKEIENSAS